MDEFRIWNNHFEHPSFNELNPTFLTNFDISQKHIYEKSIKQYADIDGNKQFWIAQDAYDRQGRLMPSYYSLHVEKCSKIRRDCSKFWRIFESIKCQYPNWMSKVYPRKPLTWENWCQKQNNK